MILLYSTFFFTYIEHKVFDYFYIMLFSCLFNCNHSFVNRKDHYFGERRSSLQNTLINERQRKRTERIE